MDGPQPESLSQSPLVEAVFELRFQAETPQVGNILPGMLYGKLKDHYPQVEPTPLSSIPHAVREGRPDLQYKTLHRLCGEEGRTLLVGDRMLAVSKQRPYPGWGQFRREILRVLEVAKETELLPAVQRYSVKYVNFFAVPHGEHFDLLQLHVDVGEHRVRQGGMNLRAELDTGCFTTIVEVSTGANMIGPAESQRGVRFSVDTIRELDGASFWENEPNLIDAAHDVVRSVFFGLLTPETLESCGPRWR